MLKISSHAVASSPVKEKSSGSDEQTGKLEPNRNYDHFDRGKREEVFPIVEIKQFSKTMDQDTVQSFLKPCMNEEKLELLEEKSELLTKLCESGSFSYSGNLDHLDDPQAMLEGSLGSVRLNVGSGSRVASVTHVGFTVKAQQQQVNGGEVQSSRRAMLSLVATGLATGSFVQVVLIDAKPIKVGPPPPPSGRLPGTLNSDEPRHLKLPLKDRFFLEPLSPTDVAQRAKESAKEIVGVKKLIEKKA
ncbi:Oxygen-evolving enhancer protein 3-2, chloroplastic [Glycine soja]|uniref:Oxygen-evolving enhancer protein 3-2, chloroplastic n=1 Tax=Glycine soja TaxID=3848 RepID=A0A445FE78_GLYSO|nr:Oxygen-evolving enhancer protein 3-2, chloroplastic [Glycine soja]